MTLPFNVFNFNYCALPLSLLIVDHGVEVLGYRIRPDLPTIGGSTDSIFDGNLTAEQSGRSFTSNLNTFGVPGSNSVSNLTAEQSGRSFTSNLNTFGVPGATYVSNLTAEQSGRSFTSNLNTFGVPGATYGGNLTTDFYRRIVLDPHQPSITLDQETLPLIVELEAQSNFHQLVVSLLVTTKPDLTGLADCDLAQLYQVIILLDYVGNLEPGVWLKVLARLTQLLSSELDLSQAEHQLALEIFLFLYRLNRQLVKPELTILIRTLSTYLLSLVETTEDWSVRVSRPYSPYLPLQAFLLLAEEIVADQVVLKASEFDQVLSTSDPVWLTAKRTIINGPYVTTEQVSSGLASLAQQDPLYYKVIVLLLTEAETSLPLVVTVSDLLVIGSPAYHQILIDKYQAYSPDGEAALIDLIYDLPPYVEALPLLKYTIEQTLSEKPSQELREVIYGLILSQQDWSQLHLSLVSQQPLTLRYQTV